MPASSNRRTRSDGYGNSAMLVADVFTGSALWWFLLSGAASLLRPLHPRRHALGEPVFRASGIRLRHRGAMAPVKRYNCSDGKQF